MSHVFQSVPVPEKVFWELCKITSLEELDDRLLELWRSHRCGLSLMVKRLKVNLKRLLIGLLS